MINFEETVQNAIQRRASDIHLATGNRPAYRIHGAVTFLDAPALSAEEADGILQKILSREKYEEFLKTGDADAAAEVPGCGRFRVNAFHQSHGPSIVMRVINATTPEITDLGLPPSISQVLEMNEGMVLVTGPTGSGKSTTLAAIINEFNKSRTSHIITIEDPIEYPHTPKRCIINQREVGEDSASYARALKAALREDPDIILVGEMRDLESISIAITAAETGHLVLSTLHTLGAAKTIDRMIDVFPPEQQQQIRTQLAMALRAVISQRLMPTADLNGRAAAFEVMYVTSAISNLIREGRTANINQMIQTGLNAGMITMEKSIGNLYRRGVISKATADEYLADLSRK